MTILRGPDKGQTRVFKSPRVTIGDDERNDIKLTDAMVSRFHGALEFDASDREAFCYHDLGSLNGTLIVSGDARHHLHDRQQHQSVQLQGKARIAMGQTLIEVVLDPGGVQISPPPRLPATGTHTRLSRPTPRHEQPERQQIDNALREGIVRRTVESPEHLARRLHSSTSQLDVLFRLSRELNGLNRLEDILARVVEATFEMFPLANFFAICVGQPRDSERMTPIFSRTRDGDASRELMLSQSLLREVVDRRESVLYVRDGLQARDSRQSIMMAQITACLAAPLIGQQKLMGVMQVDSRGQSGMFGYDDLDLFTLLASSAAFAMERAELTNDIYEMFEAFVQASVAAIDSRDPTTAGHSQRVADYTLRLAAVVNDAPGPFAHQRFSERELTELRYAALLHDFGKIGVREEVLQKAHRLPAGRLELILQRIETLRALRMAQLHAALHASLRDASRAPSAADLDQLEAQLQADHQRLDRYVDLVQTIQAPRPLSQPERDLIDEMAAVSFIDLAGHPRRLLDDHDVVNLRIPFGTLNDEERRHIESHAALSRDYLSRIPWRQELARIPCIAGDHHEKLDGSGYPQGLHSAQIIPQVRILTICDIFDALTAEDRPYKRAMSIERSCAILEEEADAGKLDAPLTRLFIHHVVPSLDLRRG